MFNVNKIYHNGNKSNDTSDKIVFSAFNSLILHCFLTMAIP